MYHGSADRVGLRWSRANAYVHVGTKAAALDRIDPSKWEADEDNPMSIDIAQGRSRVWEAQIHPDARWAPTVGSDEDFSDRWAPTAPTVMGGVERQPPEHDVYPYRNEYEDKDSISYFVNPKVIHRVRPAGRPR